MVDPKPQKYARITDYLVADHARLHALMCQATQGGGVVLEYYEAFRSGLLRHIGIEERVLFPAVKLALKGEYPPGTAQLRLEHAAITSLLVPTPDAALCHELDALLSDHDGREEGPRGVYEACEACLTAEQSAELATQAAARPEVPTMPHFDGEPGKSARVYRTRAAALEAATRVRRNRGAR